ncbi:MAG TPA: hypothetical protein VFE23_15255 [Usitatibacter sp.]|nr:hypothetical protein [Usitatibacter sp.]
MSQTSSAVRDYRIWGTITHSAPHVFVVVVSAIPALYRDQLLHNTEVVCQVCGGLVEAQLARNRMAVALGTRVDGRGDRVVDVDIG